MRLFREGKEAFSGKLQPFNVGVQKDLNALRQVAGFLSAVILNRGSTAASYRHRLACEKQTAERRNAVDWFRDSALTGTLPKLS